MEEMECVKCTFQYNIRSTADGWCVYRYKHDDGTRFIATGSYLPNIPDVQIDLYGQWKRTKNNERFFSASYGDIPKQSGKKAIISYLGSLKCGIGTNKALEIYRTYGDKTWDMMENDPWDFVNIKGIGTKMVEKMILANNNSTQKKQLILMCSDANVDLSSSMINEIIQRYGDNAAATIKENPYVLTQGHSRISFEKADALAKAFGIKDNFEPRLEAGARAVFARASVSGHTCVPKADLTINNKNYPGIVSQMSAVLRCEQTECKNALNEMRKKNEIKGANNYLFMKESYDDEDAIASNIRRLLMAEHSEIAHLEHIIDDYEKSNFKLADSQREAVRMVFRSQVSVITGGPGTGKTTVIKAVLHAHQEVFGASSDPVLLAPTGKASRRMSEATGFPAATVHSSVGYRGDELPLDETKAIEGNLVIIDESSMLDQKIASVLLNKIQTGVKVVFVGDIDQLPSVGAGNVLNDIIQSKQVPTTRLNVIFRQKGDNPIIINAAKINSGDVNLTYNELFRFFETQDDAETFYKTKRLYIHCVKQYGVDNVILLNPQRQNTDLSVGAFNKDLQKLMHHETMEKLLLKPGDHRGASVKIGNIEFMEGDRVMQLKNTERAHNGDVGVIHLIKQVPCEDDPCKMDYIIYIEFNEDGVSLEYNIDDMKDLDLAYATTVHKSQGSEYACVIEVVSMSHPTMQKRQIVYTGVTRAKKVVYLIGQRQALNNAILNGEPDLRHTLLTQRLCTTH